jgi:hypothetical protein
MNPPPQSYANHRQRFTAIYTLAGLAFLLGMILATIQLVRAPSIDAGLFLLLASGGGLLWSSVRTGELKLQNRIIRAEMQVRLERVLGAERRADIVKLTLRQLIALRFASDAELPALVGEVLAGATVEPDAIKRKVRDWQADRVRV